MRRFLLPLLLASALVPATAIAQDSDSQSDQGGERAARSDRGGRSGDRGVRMERTDRPVRMERAQPMQRAQRPDRVESAPSAELPAQGRDSSRRVRVQRAERHADGARTERNLGDRRPTLVDGFRAVAREEEQRRDIGTSDERRDGTRDGRRDGGNDRTRWADHVRESGDRWSGDHGRRDRWSSDWRRDRRYDWRHHRSRYGSLYRLGRYYDPFGWGYRRFSIGYSLRPSYYSSNYWLNDPWSYRLPPAYGPYRWVRYYDDALLVNIYSGQVVDVIHNFFW